MPQDTNPRKQQERTRVYQRFGTLTPEDEAHIDKMFSIQKGDIPLGHKAKARHSIEALLDVFQPLSARTRRR